MQRLILVVVTLGLFVGCYRDNSLFCPDYNMVTMQCPDDGGGEACKNSNECTANPDLPVCDTTFNGGTCVRCTQAEHDACPLTMRRCENHTCVKCIDDNDCDARGVCLPDGSCAMQANIIHVRVGGSTSDGCGAIGNECTLTKALTEASAPRNVLKLDDAGPHMPSSASFLVSKEVTIDARGAVLTRGGNDDPILLVNGIKATILGGTIRGAAGSKGAGIRCESNATVTVIDTSIESNESSGIDVADSTLIVKNARIHSNGSRGTGIPGINVDKGSVTLSRSWITSNRGGGLIVTDEETSFVIVGNVFLNNGNDSGTVGGISITNALAPGSRLEFNTIAANKGQPAAVVGIQCSANAALVAQNNIIWRNNGDAGVQVGGACPHDYSDIGPVGVPGPINRPNNINTNPMLKDEMTDPHLTSASPAMLSGANPGAMLDELAAKDIDGDLRAAPFDMGADQSP